MNAAIRSSVVLGKHDVIVEQTLHWNPHQLLKDIAPIVTICLGLSLPTFRLVRSRQCVKNRSYTTLSLGRYTSMHYHRTTILQCKLRLSASLSLVFFLAVIFLCRLCRSHFNYFAVWTNVKLLLSTKSGICHISPHLVQEVCQFGSF
jgi:hypothetical protein